MSTYDFSLAAFAMACLFLGFLIPAVPRGGLRLRRPLRWQRIMRRQLSDVNTTLELIHARLVAMDERPPQAKPVDPFPGRPSINPIYGCSVKHLVPNAETHCRLFAKGDAYMIVGVTYSDADPLNIMPLCNCITQKAKYHIPAKAQ